MDILVSHDALQRRTTTKLALSVLEAAVAEVMGFSVAIRGLQLWISPAIFDEGRIPERYLHVPPGAPGDESGQLPGPDHPLRLQEPSQPLLPHFRQWYDVTSAREMIRRRRVRE